MNNIAQKNVIFENVRNNGFPYYNIGSIQYVGGQNINFATLNNTFQQLIDNDLYAENYIKNYADSAIGPKSSAPSAVYAGVEGYKAFSDDGVQMHIYRKHENPLSSSVSCVLKDVHANFIFQNGQYVVVGCDEGIYFEQDGFHRLSDDIPAYGQYSDDSVCLIASDDGIYSMVLKSGYGISQYHKFIKLNSNDIGRCRSVRYIDETHTIIAGTDDGIYEGFCHLYQLNMDEISCSIDFKKMKMLADADQIEPRVNSIGLSGSIPLAATSAGLFKPDQVYDFTGYGCELSGQRVVYQIDNGSKWLVGTNDGIYSVSYDYGSKKTKVIDLPDSIAAVSSLNCIYFATSQAIYRYSGDSLVPVVNGFNGIAAIQVYTAGDSEFLIFADGTTIYYMNNDSDYSELFDLSATVNDIHVERNILIAATSRGVYQYRLHADVVTRDSEKIISAEQVYASVLDDDFNPSGIISLSGNLFAYSDAGIKGLDTPAVFTRTPAKCCCTYQREDGSMAVVAASGKDVYFLNDQFFVQSHVLAPSDVVDIKTTNHVILFRLADKSVWQIHKKKAFTLDPTLTVVEGAQGTDDFSTYSEFAALRQNTALKFLQERTSPSRLAKLSGEIITGLRYNGDFDTVFVSTKTGLSAVDMSKYPYVEERIYTGPTYGCWTDQNAVYCFTPHGVDVYNIRRVQDDDNPDEFKADYISAYNVLNGESVNDMCKFDGRLLYATANGLYASVNAEKYDTIVDFSEKDIQFCHKFSKSDTSSEYSVFMLYDGNAFFSYDTRSKTQSAISSNVCGKSGVSVVGSAVSMYGDLLYIATSNGMCTYDVNSNAFSAMQLGGQPLSTAVIGIQTVQYADGVAKIIAETYDGEKNRFFDEASPGVFWEMNVPQAVIDKSSSDRLLHVEAVPCDGIKNAQLFMYLQADSKYSVRTVQVTHTGIISPECDFTVSTDIKYDKICASRDRVVYLTHSSDDSVSSWTYDFDKAGEKFGDLSVNVQDVMKDDAGRMYVKLAGDGYYQIDGGQMTRLPISDKKYSGGESWRLLGINQLQSYGYAVIGGIGVISIQPDPTATVPIRTNFDNSDLKSIQNIFGLILTSYNNKLYYSDVNSVDELRDPNNYRSLLDQSEHFTKYCVSEELGIVYAFGTKFICTWSAYDKQSLIDNARNYVKEIFESNFTLYNLIPHESYKIDIYLQNGVDYVKPYMFAGSSSTGIYVYNPDNIAMAVKQSDLKFASRLFQVPDGLAFMAANGGVQYTVNCDNAEPFTIRGLSFTNQTYDIKYDGQRYYINVGGRWYYIYHKKLISIPGSMPISNIINASNGTVFLSGSEFYKFNYYKMLFITASKVESGLDKYNVYRIFNQQGQVYYAIRDTVGVRLADSRYMPVRLQFENRSGSNVFDDICFSADGSMFVVQIGGSLYFANDIGEEAALYKASGLVFPMNIYVKDGYTAFDTINGIIRFGNYGIVNVYKRVDEMPVNFLKIQKIANDDYILCSAEGLYRYIQDFIYKMQRDTDPATAIYIDMFDGEPGYIVAVRQQVTRSRDLIDWNSLFSVGAGAVVSDIYAKSRNDYYVATDSGIFKTIYGYELINDIEQRNEYELQAVVDSLQDDLDATFEYQLEKHVLSAHSADSQMNFINTRLLSVDMSGISEDWQQMETGTELVIDNDLVETMDFGDISALGCDISTENVIFSQAHAPADYVLKRYMSGVSELFVHVQTTNTYYLNGVPGSPVPNDELQEISRKNLENISDLDIGKKRQNSSVSQHATLISLDIPKQVMNITDVHDVQISPCSLPLKVYMENVDVNDQEKNGIFNSKVIPSIVLSYGINDTGATFKFACFGTDEQAIRIQFTEQYIAAGTITVEFMPNGGSGVMPSQKFVLDSPSRLNAVLFINGEKFFAGWSLTPLQDGQQPTYTNMQYIQFSSEKYKNGDVIRLYAVWTKQDIEGDANVFGIESDSTPLYIKTAVEVIPGQTIIDYGDDGSYVPNEGSLMKDYDDYYDEPDPEDRKRIYDEDSILSSDYQSIIDGITDDLDDGSVIKG